MNADSTVKEYSYIYYYVIIWHRYILTLETNSWKKQKQKRFRLSEVSDKARNSTGRLL